MPLSGASPRTSEDAVGGIGYIGFPETDTCGSSILRVYLLPAVPARPPSSTPLLPVAGPVDDGSSALSSAASIVLVGWKMSVESSQYVITTVRQPTRPMSLLSVGGALSPCRARKEKEVPLLDAASTHLSLIPEALVLMETFVWTAP